MTHQVLRPETARRHYAMLWSHAYGRPMGYLRVLWTRGCKTPYVYLIGSIRFTCGHPRGHCGFHTGMGTSVHSVFRGPTRYGEARKCTPGLYLPSQTRLCDI